MVIIVIIRRCFQKKNPPSFYEKEDSGLANFFQNHAVSKSLTSRIVLLLGTIAFLTLIFASLPLFHVLSKDQGEMIGIEVVERVFLFGFLSLCIMIPFASWLIQKKILSPLKDMLMAARKVADGNLDIWETTSSLTDIQELSGAIQNIATHLKTVLKNIVSATKTLSIMAESISTNSRKITRGAKNEADSLDSACSSVEELTRSIQGIGQSVESLASSAEETSSSILEMTASIDQVANSTGLLSESVERTSSSIFEMTASIKQIAEGVERLSASSEDLVSTIAEIDTSIHEVASHAKESVEIAGNVATDAAEMGMMSVVDTMDGMDQIQEAVEKSAGIVMSLYQRSEEIGRILTVINEVADQTELLSLNASILAAQAGENGKGFAVVANEIKALAERTASSTKEITGIIKAVQKEAKEAVESIQAGKEKAEQGKSLSMEAGTALNKILGSSRKAASMAKEIERTTVEQSKGIVSVRSAVDHMNTMIEQIHQAINNQKTGSENVQSATEQINDLTRQVKYAMAEQAKGGRQIGGAVENVLHQVQQMEIAVKEQKNGSELIVKAVDNIRKSTQEKVGISSELDTSIRSLLDEQTLLKELVSRFKTG